jgi:tRNA(fMet)-specific endonuclease VapC
VRYLLDTNVCIAAMRRNGVVLGHLAKVSPEDCAVSMISVYELLTGVGKSARPAENGRKLQRFLAEVHVLPFDFASAQRAAEVRVALESAGLVIGSYDLQIAGQALAHELICVTHNTREFSRVDGLRCEDWEI